MGTCPWASPKPVLRADGGREFQLTDESLLKTGPRMTHIHGSGSRAHSRLTEAESQGDGAGICILTKASDES